MPRGTVAVPGTARRKRGDGGEVSGARAFVVAEQFAVRIFSGMVSSASAAMPSWNSGKTKSPLSAGIAEVSLCIPISTRPSAVVLPYMIVP